MAKDPAFLFYSSDFLTGIEFFSYEQTGRYIKLLCLQHQHGRLKEKYLRQICGDDADVLQKFARDEAGLYYNERLEIEINKRKEYCDSRRENRLKGTTAARRTQKPPPTNATPGAGGSKQKAGTNTQQKTKAAPILFEASEIGELAKFKEVFGGEGSKYRMFNHEYYYEAVMNWAESQQVKKINWIATARGFMLRDSRDKKAVLHGQNLLQHETRTNSRQQQYDAVERALAARYGGDKGE